jgi:hypothetical protein
MANTKANSLVSRRMVQVRPRPITPDNTEGRLPREDSSQAILASQPIRVVSHHTRVVVMVADTKRPVRGHNKGVYEIGVAAVGYMMDKFWRADG